MADIKSLMGWAGPAHADKAWEQIGSQVPKFFIAGQVSSTEGRTFRAWDVWRKLNGGDYERTIQETGDCVGQSATDAIEALQWVEIAAGDQDKFTRLLTSYHYATGRVLVGKGQLKGGAGSIGSWQALALQKYGTLNNEHDGVPKYSGALSDKWGDDHLSGSVSFRKFIDEGDDHVVRTASRVTDWSQLRDAICNGHLGTIASNRGYNMKPTGGNLGFHKPKGEWGHQMSILALSDDPACSWVGIGNQWGDVHGQVIDLEDGSVWPTGMLRVTREDFEKSHLTEDAECFVYSSFEGYPDRTEALDGLLI